MGSRDSIGSAKNHLIFVYGTLKRGCRNHHYLKDAAFLGQAETCEKYSMRKHEYWYPAVIESISNYTIPGELWMCSEDTAKLLDRLEDYPDLFYREEVPVLLGANVLSAWMYFFNVNRKDAKNELREQILEWVE